MESMAAGSDGQVLVGSLMDLAHHALKHNVGNPEPGSVDGVHG